MLRLTNQNHVMCIMHCFTRLDSLAWTEPPEFEIEPQSQLGTIGSDVVIKCVVKGNPQPTVTWRVNGRPLNGKHS